MRRACMHVLEKQILCCASLPANAHAFWHLYADVHAWRTVALSCYCVNGAFLSSTVPQGWIYQREISIMGYSHFPEVSRWYRSERYLFLSSSLPMISLNKSNLLFVIIVLPSCPVVFFLLQKRITHKNSSSLNESTLFPSLWQALSQSKR